MAGKPLELLIFGTGAVGSIFGWRATQRAGVRLSVVCRSNYDAVKGHGLRFRTDMWGDGAISPHRIVRSPEELEDVNFYYVVCANKFIPHQARSISESLRPVVKRDTALVTVQNGVGVESPLRSVYPSNTVLSSVCYISCLQSSMGVVDQVSQIRPHAFHIGAFGEGNTNAVKDQERLQRLVSLDSKFKAIDDINVERWSKMIFNGAWNPATAVLGLDTHQIIKESPTGVALVRKLAREVSQVGLRSGVQPQRDLDELIIASAAAAPTIAPSMLQDARKRQQMEVEAICGTICRMADSFGLQVPTVKATYCALLRMNQSFLMDKYPVEKPDVGILDGLRTTGEFAAPIAVAF